MISPSEPTSKYEGSLNRHYNHRMQILFPSPAARPESPPPVQFQGPAESDSRRSSFNDAEPSRVLRDVRREEEVEFEIRCRIRGLERCQTSGDEHGKEWED